MFFGFRVMVGMWLVMLAHDGVGVDARAARGGSTTSPAFLRAAIWAIPSGYIAVTAGWITTEVGRQPWVVYGHLRTADAVTPTLTGGDVLASLVLYVDRLRGHLRRGRVLPRAARAARRARGAARAARSTSGPARPLSAATDGD